MSQIRIKYTYGGSKTFAASAAVDSAGCKDMMILSVTKTTSLSNEFFVIITLSTLHSDP